MQAIKRTIMVSILKKLPDFYLIKRQLDQLKHWPSSLVTVSKGIILSLKHHWKENFRTTHPSIEGLTSRGQTLSHQELCTQAQIVNEATDQKQTLGLTVTATIHKPTVTRIHRTHRKPQRRQLEREEDDPFPGLGKLKLCSTYIMKIGKVEVQH